MNRLELVRKLNALLLDEMPEHRDSAAGFSLDYASQRRLLRSLMNLWPPMQLDKTYVELQDQLLAAEREEKGIVDIASLPTLTDPRIKLWRGDITRLNADAIINAANSALLGCFHPCHGCIDNAIHSAAGLQLRDECYSIMVEQGFEERCGQAKITAAWNLPCKYVLHTVGPIITGELHQSDCDLLASCYRSCLEMAEQHHLKSIAFCCISTGEYHFPADEAAHIAIAAVKEHILNTKSEMKVVFNVFRESDEAIYRRILGANRQAEGTH
ncbi:MAG: protein-ADP-ribose hydrolase [Christensenellales bacterium]